MNKQIIELNSEKLINLKKNIQSTIQEITKNLEESGLNEEKEEVITKQTNILNDLENTINRIDNLFGLNLEDRLKTKFGDHEWKIKLKQLLRPSFLKSTNESHYRYVIQNISWVDGPNSHQVFYWLLNTYGYYLESKEYNYTIFQHERTNIEKYVTCAFNVMTINNDMFVPLEVNFSRVFNKINDKVTTEYYVIDAVDSKLGIQNIKAETKHELYIKFQEAVEELYYRPAHDPKRKQLERYIRQKDVYMNGEEEDQEQEEEGGGEETSISNKRHVDIRDT